MPDTTKHMPGQWVVDGLDYWYNKTRECFDSEDSARAAFALSAAPVTLLRAQTDGRLGYVDAKK